MISTENGLYLRIVIKINVQNEKLMKLYNVIELSFNTNFHYSRDFKIYSVLCFSNMFQWKNYFLIFVSKSCSEITFFLL